MPRILILPAILALAGLGACASGTGSNTARTIASSSAPAITETADAQVCNDDLAQSAIGKKADEALIEEYRQRSQSKFARMLRPRSVMTMEYNPQRLNLRVDDNDIVMSVNCG
ncbi:I78 family peptidase inhibitor [Parapusillimonas sp. JC17]|uniref:I78 family peptidase inhibitor n=1 Tax=Parapusillimonas sp. JC17 TaxID=3445768 RepID=UPI003FA1055C